MSNQFERPKTRALDDQPLTKIREVQIVATDADGGVTRATLTGDSINMELMPGNGSGGWIGVRESGKKAITQSHPFVSGHFVARGVEYAEVTYTEPEKPAKRWEIGTIVKLPRSLTPANLPYRKRGWLGELTEVTWQEYSKCWQYHFQDRDRKNGIYVNESREMDKVQVMDRWPLRQGDFVVMKPQPFDLNPTEVFKLLKRTKPEDIDVETPGWWLSKENGPTGTYLRDDQAVLVTDVKVAKRVTWTRG